MQALAPSFDKVCGLVVTSGCLFTLWDAYTEGRAPLVGQIAASTVVPKSRNALLSAQHRHDLSKNGYVVIDGFLKPHEVLDARRSIEHNSHRFKPSPNQKVGDSVRSDCVYWEKESNEDVSITAIRHKLHDLARELDKDMYIPESMQVSKYEDSSYYESHLDTCTDSMMELGLLGYLRSAYLRCRYRTCIVYLNDFYETSHGGCLRISSGNHEEIEPIGGRLVIFDSAIIWHAVLAS